MNAEYFQVIEERYANVSMQEIQLKQHNIFSLYLSLSHTHTHTHSKTVTSSTCSSFDC
jgi:hypothetical protein